MKLINSNEIYMHTHELVFISIIFSFQEGTGLHPEQVDALKNGFDGFDKENSGLISPTAMQMIFKMIGVTVQVIIETNDCTRLLIFIHLLKMRLSLKQWKMLYLCHIIYHFRF